MTEFADNVRQAAVAMRALFPATPMQRNAHLSAKYDADIWLKREDLSPVRSYKLRGAFNAMSKRIAENPDQQLFVCASAGNHAQGVAFVCNRLDRKGVIFMPVTTPQQKIDKTKVFGGEHIEVRLVGDYFDDCLRAAQEFCAAEGGQFLPPFDDPDVIEGQATVTMEILDQMPRVPDRIILPVGGGGLSAGARAYLNALNADVHLNFVEPKGGASLTAALEAREPVTLNKVDTFVDGAAVARIGANTFSVLSDTAPQDVLLATEDGVCTTILEMLNIEGIVLEPAGALSIKVLDDLRDEIRGQTVVCVSSGGNFDFERLPEVKERAQRYLGLKKYFILRLPQRPGALKDFLGMLGPDDDIARFEYLKKSARNFGSVLIGIETKSASNFERLFGLMEEAGFVFNDITDDETLVNFVI
ncbi:threonine ammonia-lyase IlvA [Shimia ponticola]|uniref:threonine ammonia-lyase IlvA n=1 Tax=Shimia ponticola TaxID=2582893 RepID=UPI0011BF3561|nr:threonine ammonia-lyase IlvA [Shimia ponticola]